MWGAIDGAANRVRARGRHIAYAHLVHLNPFPANLGEVLRRYPKVVVPELNLGQLSRVLRAEFLVDDSAESRDLVERLVTKYHPHLERRWGGRTMPPDRVMFRIMPTRVTTWGLAESRAWRALLFDHGFGWLTGPPEFGGRDLPMAYEQRFRRLGEVEERGVPRQRPLQNVIDLAGLEIEVAVEDEVRDRNQMDVDDAVGALRIAQRHRLLGRGDDLIGRDHEISGASHDPRAGDVGAARRGCDGKHNNGLIAPATRLIHAQTPGSHRLRRMRRRLPAPPIGPR